MRSTESLAVPPGPLPVVSDSAADAAGGAVSGWAAPGVRRTVSSRALLVAIAGTAYLAVNLATLTRSPTPWFDETFFASIADSLVRTGELKLSVSPLWFDKPVYIYGPVYFLITGSVIKCFGLGILQFRLVGLLFGLATIVVVFLLLREVKADRVGIAVCGLLALDPAFYKGIHSGRLDTTALCFLLLSLLFVLKSKNADESRAVHLSIASGIVAGTGVLTTPRPGYMLIPIVMILLFRVWRTRSTSRVLQLVAWSIAFLALCVPWFLYAFGSVSQLVRYYAEIPGSYLGGNLNIPPMQYPLLVALIGLIFAKGVRSARSLFDELLVFVLVGIVCFYALVREMGPYSVLMVPLVYLGIASLLSRLGGSGQRFAQYGVIGVLLMLNGSAFAARNAAVFLAWEKRDPALAEKSIANVIPPGAKVIGDDRYYYAVRRSGSDFQYLQRGGTLAERVLYHKNVYGAEYLVTDDGDESPVLKSYGSEFALVEVGETRASTQASSRLGLWISTLARRAGFPTDEGYQGTMFHLRERGESTRAAK